MKSAWNAGDVREMEDLAGLIQDAGFVPFFRTDGLRSLEDLIVPERWFGDIEGPWEWKGMLASQKRCVYGKFCANGAAFIAPDLFPALMCIRRNGYDFEGMWEDGLMTSTAHAIMGHFAEHGPSRAKDVRKAIGKPKDFDREIVRLQMLTFLIHRDFVYDIDRYGKPYGWGNALLDTPENMYGMDYVLLADNYTEETALQTILARMMPLIVSQDTDIRPLLMGKRMRRNRI